MRRPLLTAGRSGRLAQPVRLAASLVKINSTRGRDLARKLIQTPGPRVEPPQRDRTDQSPERNPCLAFNASESTYSPRSACWSPSRIAPYSPQ